MKKLRVPLPVYRTTEMLSLAKELSIKHLADGETSVLKNINLDLFHQEVARASLLNDEAEALRNQSSQRIIERDALLKSISHNVRRCRDVLTGIHISNMKNLTEWGYTVIEAPASASKAKTAKTKASAPVQSSSVDNTNG